MPLTHYKYGVPSHYSDATGEFTGTITSVDPDGHLHITESDGLDRRYAFKEVSYIKSKHDNNSHFTHSKSTAQ